jgi:peroxiredoxin
MIGSPAPDFTLRDSDRTVSLRELRGKPVVLNFWAAHCPPCVDEMPSLVQLQHRMGPRVTVLGVGVDTNEADYHRFLRNYQIDFLTVLDAGKESYNRYGATGYPETFIIDASGIVRRKFVGPVNWTSPEILEYLNKFSN